jgi:hypothetical protein
MEKRRQPEVITGYVNADGSIGSGDGFTVAKGTAGNYTITFPPSFRMISLSGSSGVANGTFTLVNAPATQPQLVRLYTANTAALVDSPFSFIAIGVQQ